MFVRKKPNKSGKVSVQVVLKSRERKQQVVKTIGCSDDADEIERLVAEGRKNQWDGSLIDNKIAETYSECCKQLYIRVPFKKYALKG